MAEDRGGGVTIELVHPWLRWWALKDTQVGAWKGCSRVHCSVIASQTDVTIEWTETAGQTNACAKRRERTYDRKWQPVLKLTVAYGRPNHERSKASRRWMT
jgi:hypothetical protein